MTEISGELMLPCPSCRAAVPWDAVFCPSCGMQLSLEAPTTFSEPTDSPPAPRVNRNDASYTDRTANYSRSDDWATTSDGDKQFWISVLRFLGGLFAVMAFIGGIVWAVIIRSNAGSITFMLLTLFGTWIGGFVILTLSMVLANWFDDIRLMSSAICERAEKKHE